MKEENQKTEIERMAELAAGADGSEPSAVAERRPVTTPAPGEAGATETQSLEAMAKSVVPMDPGALEESIVEALQSIYDPEIPVNIHELGLIYGLKVSEGGKVDIEMTLTAPGCPVAGPIVDEVEFKVTALPGVSTCKVELVWEPPWAMDKMSEAARLQLGFF